MLYRKCPHCNETKALEYFYNNRQSKNGKSCWCKECHSLDNKRYSKDNAIRKEYHRNYYLNNIDRIRKLCRDRRQRIKEEVLTYYGNGKLACVYCNESRIDCLSIDHINENGAEHRRQIGLSKSVHFVEWLKQNNYPEGYQTLCMNCQWIKHKNWKDAKENEID